MKLFDVPIVLFVFKRIDTLARILDSIQNINPSKLYILSDGGRNEEEMNMVQQCRDFIDDYTSNWDCEIIRRYHQNNVGVYENIGEGAKWVFSKEKTAIFLEDDNLPEATFFTYCEHLLNRYQEDSRVLWICGTNYLGTYDSDVSYMFTQNLLPCGWASWSYKFLQCYDGQLDTIKDWRDIGRLKKSYRSWRLFHQQAYSIYHEFKKKKQGKRFNSWDYQMAYSIRKNNLLGISPKYNQIRNIGIDEFSTHTDHGNSKISDEMTRRFCEISTIPIETFIDPINVEIDRNYEKQIDRIVTYPFSVWPITYITYLIKKILGLNPYESVTEGLKQKKMEKI
ncbi:glycosyltransferase family 2 protein [Streptococcus sp. S784/96/1]|uniref:glycosyltransferase family 2 protein n=1 Tax=Streptococcus sp. S784/96/1 TaxID=2653499 RepID=UPI00138674CC|nr:glycosyltransferase family 2 protein [Streptococcus sp. S784/96/1]